MITGKHLCRFCAGTVLCLLTAAAYAQNDDIRFALYLLENRRFDEALLLLEDDPAHRQPADSMRYIRGMAHYYRKELFESVFQLERVSNSSTFYDKATFFSALNCAHLGEYAKAQNILECYRTAQPGKNSRLLTLQLAGLALLNRDAATFERHAERFEQGGSYLYADSEKQLLGVRDALTGHRKKSQFVAGMLSAVVPGAGKIYAGRTGEGIAALLTVGGLAAMTIENWSKHGPANWKTITLGTLFSVFYIGNIYGSAASVKIYRTQFNEQQNNIILLGIHLPVRALFE